MSDRGLIPPSDKPTLETGGTHYHTGGIQPIEFIEANAIPFHEANVIKYVFRWRQKDGLSDLQKAKWYIDRLIELEEKRAATTVASSAAPCGPGEFGRSLPIPPPLPLTGLPLSPLTGRPMAPGPLGR